MKKLLLIFLLPLIGWSSVTIYQKERIIRKPIKSWIEFKNENLTRQQFDYSCGGASLSTIMRFFYDQNISEIDVLNTLMEIKGIAGKELTDLEDHEMRFSFYDLSRYIEKVGYKAMGIALDMQSLAKLKVPVILYIKVRKDEHFTVFKGMDRSFVYLADPSFGNIKVRIGKFKEMFYQRKAKKYPGKLLAIIPRTNEQLDHINYDFMKIPKSSDFIYRVINTDQIIQ